MPHIHLNARTTPAILPEITCSTKPSGTVAKRYGISAWIERKRRAQGAADCLDRSARLPKLPWKATEQERAIVCTLRRTINFPFDNLTFVGLPLFRCSHFLPHLNYDSIWRILKAEGLNQRPNPFRTPRQRPGNVLRLRPRLRAHRH